MTWLLIRLLIRVVVFGVAFTFACRRIEKVKVEPRSAIPLVALVFALLNTGLYWALSGLLSVIAVFLWVVWLVAPFIANLVLLLFTDRLLKALKIETLGALMRLTVVITVAHILLRVVEHFI
jgi:hypothetical protein